MKSERVIIITVLFMLSAISFAAPPAGYSWIPIPEFTDEFNGTALDTVKWRDYHPYWSGRDSTHEPFNVSVSGGDLRLVSSLYDTGNTTVNAGTVTAACVSSRNRNCDPGYYEARIQASSLSMTSAFWFQGNPTEIDVIENIGDASNSSSTWIENTMMMNTHYYPDGFNTPTHVKTPRQWTMPTLAREEYHVYGVWWKDGNTIWFYHNDVKVAEATPGGPFNVKQYMFFDTEVFTWHGWPLYENLIDPTKNTMYVDWVRAWEYVETPVCGSPGTVMAADISGPSGQPDCYINMYDMTALADHWLDCTLPGRAGCVGTGSWDIEIKPSSTAAITINGDLSDWASVQWHNANYERGSGTDDLSNAQVAFLWDGTEEVLYVAARVDDAALALSATAGNWDEWDSFEISCKGDGVLSDDTSWKDSLTFAEAQQWRIGIIPSGGAWLGSLVAAHPGTVEQSGSVSGNTLYYEAKIKQYSFYDKNNTANSVLADLDVGAEILCFVDLMSGKNAPSNGPYWHGLPDGRVHNVPSSWARLRLVDADGNDGAVCGDYGYPDADIVPDCVVDMKDWYEIALKWMDCTEPTDENCEMIQ